MAREQINSNIPRDGAALVPVRRRCNPRSAHSGHPAMHLGEGQQFVNRIGGDCNKRFVTRGCLSMSEFDNLSIGHEPARSSPSRDLIVVAEHLEARAAAEPAGATANRLFLSRLPIAAAAALAVVAGVADVFFGEPAADEGSRRAGERKCNSRSHNQVAESAPRCNRYRHVKRQPRRPAVRRGNQVDCRFDTGDQRRFGPTLPTRRQAGP